MTTRLLPHRVALITAALCFTGAAICGSAHAQTTAESRQAYDIAPGPLDATLMRIARESGRALSFAPELVRGKSAGAVQGELSVEQALNAALSGTGLRPAVKPDGTLTLTVAPPAAEGAVLMQAVQVEATATRDAVTERSDSYTAHSASTSSRLPLSLRETPQSVTVVTRQQIEDRNFVTLDDVMATVPGITSSTANFNRVSYSARGFSLTDNMVDGMPSVGNAYAGYVPNMAFYDHVEVLRGSAGLAYGAPPLVGSAGGTVNLIRKKPTAERQLSASVRRGSWNNNYVELDASGPISKGGDVRGRMVVAYEDRETFIDYEYARRPSVYGIVETRLGDSTTVHAGGSIERYDGNYTPYGLPRYTDGSDLGLPRSSRGLSPAWTHYFTDVDTLFAGLEHHFSDRWSLRLAANTQDRVQGGNVFNARGAVDPETGMGPTYGTSVDDSYSPAQYSAYDALVSGGFDLFGQAHELIFGATWGEIDGKRGRSATGKAPTVDQSIFDFDPWAVPRPAMSAYVPTTSSTDYNTSGIYGVARLSLADPLKLIVGGRLSSLETETLTYATGVKTRRRESDVFNPYAGLVYDFAEHWSAYASYSDIFRAQYTLYMANGDTLKPVTGVNYEAGAKGEFYDGKLNVSFAVFRVEENNRSQVDPENPAPCAGTPTGTGDCYLATGKVRGEGFEAELSGNLLPGLETTAGYTFVETEYLRDRTASGAPSANQGQPFNTFTPKHLFRLWANYRLPGDWKRYSVGGGVNTQSAIYSQSGTLRIDNGGYTLLSARAGYQFDDNWSLGLNGNNLTDKKYYQSLGSTSNGNRYGEPRSWMVSVRGRF